MGFAEQYKLIQDQLSGRATLIAVSKTYPVSVLEQAYQAGCKIFGENKVQELTQKYEALPKDIEWHLIGHLQSNKVKYIAPFVNLIHSIDSFKLLEEVHKQALKNNRVINCLLQIHIAKEESKFGLDYNQAETMLQSKELVSLTHIKIVGFMGMATFTDKEQQIREEFRTLKEFFNKWQSYSKPTIKITELSMGMSNDYQIALEEGSTMVRVGSLLFGKRS